MKQARTGKARERFAVSRAKAELAKEFGQSSKRKDWQKKENQSYRHKSFQFVQGKREKNPHEENKLGPQEYFELLHLMHCKERNVK